MDLNLKVQGLVELEKQLLKLGATVAEDQLHGALRNAALPTSKRAKAEAPGSLKTAISTVRHRSKKTRRLSIKGIAATGKNAAGVSIIVRKKKAPHAHLVEFGTQQRKTKGKGRQRPYRNANRGSMPAQHFMLRAWASEGEEKALKRFQKNLKNRIKRITK